MADFNAPTLDVTNRSDSYEDLAGEEPDQEEDLETHCRETIVRLCDLCGQDDGSSRPLRVALIGMPGVGKSSFINGVAAALSRDRWREYAYSGSMAHTFPVTNYNEGFPKCCNVRHEKYRHVLLPTLLDLPGLLDESDPRIVQLFRLLLHGHVQDDSSMMKVFWDVLRLGELELHRKYRKSYPECKVDRVIVLASAVKTLPEKLLSCIWKAARPDHQENTRRSVPVFGVLTNRDRVDVNSEEFRRCKRSFMVNLGLLGNRLLVCTNYCDDIDPEGQRLDRCLPELDLPILRFMLQVCDPAFKVRMDDEQLPGFDIGPVAEEREQGTSQEPQGTSQDPQGTSQDPQGTSQDPQGTSQDPQGTFQNQQDTCQETVYFGSSTIPCLFVVLSVIVLVIALLLKVSG